MRAVGEHEEARLFAFEELLDHDFAAGLAEGSAEHGVDSGGRGRERFGDDDALALGEAIGLDHDGMGEGAEIRLRCCSIVETLVGRGRDAVLGAEIFDVAFRRLELSRRRRGAERLDSSGLKTIGETGGQRRFRPDHGKIDAGGFGEGNELIKRQGVNRDALRNLSNAGIAGGAVELGDQWARREGPCERVLASARSDQKDVHAPRPIFVTRFKRGLSIGIRWTKPLGADSIVSTRNAEFYTSRSVVVQAKRGQQGRLCMAQFSDVALERLMKYEQMAADAHRRAATAENMEDRAYYIEVAMEWEGLAARLKEAVERGVQGPNSGAPARPLSPLATHH